MSAGLLTSTSRGGGAPSPGGGPRFGRREAGRGRPVGGIGQRSRGVDNWYTALDVVSNTRAGCYQRVLPTRRGGRGDLTGLVRPGARSRPDPDFRTRPVRKLGERAVLRPRILRSLPIAHLRELESTSPPTRGAAQRGSRRLISLSASWRRGLGSCSLAHRTRQARRLPSPAGRTSARLRGAS